MRAPALSASYEHCRAAQNSHHELSPQKRRYKQGPDIRNGNSRKQLLSQPSIIKIVSIFVWTIKNSFSLPLLLVLQYSGSFGRMWVLGEKAVTDSEYCSQYSQKCESQYIMASWPVVDTAKVDSVCMHVHTCMLYVGLKTH